MSIPTHARRISLKVLLALALIVLAIPCFAAFEAHTVNVTAHIENALHVDPPAIDFGVVFPQEELEKEFDIRLSDSFMEQERATDVFYRITITRKPLVEGDTSLEEEDLYADLRPYAQVVKTDESDPDAFEFSDLGNSWWSVPGDPTSESLRDLVDTWRVDLSVPCIVGAVGRDYSGPIAPAEDDYGLDVHIDVIGLSYGRHIHKLAVGPRVVPIETPVEWTICIPVKNTSVNETMHNVIVTDRFNAELDCLDAYSVSFAYGSPVSTVVQDTTNSGRQDRITWTIDELGPLNRGVLVLTVRTKLNAAGRQEYSTPGLYTLNSGAVLKWTDDSGEQQSENTEPISIEAVAP